MSTIVNNNRGAIDVIAWLTLPSGLLTVIGLSSLLESIGIALFYSGLFVQKATIYASKIGVDAAVLAGVVSFVLGLVLAILNSVGVMVLRLIGEITWSRLFALVFLGLAVFSYYNTVKMDTSTGFNYGLFMGVLFMVLVPSVLINVLSGHLALKIVGADWFAEMTAQIYERASGRRKNELSQMIVNRNGQLKTVK